MLLQGKLINNNFYKVVNEDALTINDKLFLIKIVNGKRNICIKDLTLCTNEELDKYDAKFKLEKDGELNYLYDYNSLSEEMKLNLIRRINFVLDINENEDKKYSIRGDKRRFNSLDEIIFDLERIFNENNIKFIK